MVPGDEIRTALFAQLTIRNEVEVTRLRMEEESIRLDIYVQRTKRTDLILCMIWRRIAWI